MLIYIDDDIFDLIPEFMSRRRAEIPILISLLENNDLKSISQLGHKLKGTGGSYGINILSILGENLENAVLKNDHAQLNQLVQEFQKIITELTFLPESKRAS